MTVPYRLVKTSSRGRTTKRPTPTTITAKFVVCAPVRTTFCGKVNCFQLFVISSRIAIPFAAPALEEPRWIRPIGIPLPEALEEA